MVRKTSVNQTGAKTHSHGSGAPTILAVRSPSVNHHAAPTLLRAFILNKSRGENTGPQETVLSGAPKLDNLVFLTEPRSKLREAGQGGFAGGPDGGLRHRDLSSYPYIVAPCSKCWQLLEIWRRAGTLPLGLQTLGLQTLGWRGNLLRGHPPPSHLKGG